MYLSFLRVAFWRKTLLVLTSSLGQKTEGIMLDKYCQAQVQALIPNSKSKIQVQSLDSKVQRKGTGTWADNMILKAWSNIRTSLSPGLN